MDVTLIPNPDFEADTPEKKAAYADVKKRGPIDRVSMATALENIRLSGGMYRIKPEGVPEASAPLKAMSLDDMSNEDLKVMMLKLGVVPQKQMKRPEVIKMIRLKLAEVEITEEADGV